MKNDKPNYQNEKAKRDYLIHVKETGKYKDNTINSIGKSLHLWDILTNMEDYKIFNKEKIISFKKQLAEKINPKNQKKVSPQTQYHYLRHLREFFIWLSYQKGYRSKINQTDIAYLALDPESKMIALTKTDREIPNLEQIKQVIHNIKVENEVDKRDVALICFTILAGVRDMAIATLPIGSFDEKTHVIKQIPKYGVKTKFSKKILGYLFKVDMELVEIVLEWINYLKKEKGYNVNDPLFPASKLDHGKENTHCFEATKVGKDFWKSTNPIRKIFQKRFQEANVAYFPPHTFRHCLMNLIKKNTTTNEEMGAVAQIFGHSFLETAFGYGYSSPDRIIEIAGNIDFSGKQKSLNEMGKQINEIQKNMVKLNLSTEK